MKKFLFLIFLFYSLYVNAAIPVENGIQYYFTIAGGVEYRGENPSSVCNKIPDPPFFEVKLGANNYCVGRRRLDGGGSSYFSSPVEAKYGYVCPANSSLSGNECLCNSGFVEENNQCIPEPEIDPCEMLESACAGNQNFSVNFQLGGKKTGVSFVCMNPVVIGDDGSFPGCTRGCLGIVGGFTSAFQSDGGEWVTQGTAKFTGSTCDPSVINDLNSDSDPEYEPEDNPALTEKPDETCPNGFKGTVNGVSVCLPPKASEGLLEKEEKDNGDGTKTEKQTKVKCENGLCEITTTTITKDTVSNTVVGNSSATTTVEQGRFCAQNPTAAACKNGDESGGSFSGSCQAGFTCDGDAVMCAIAKEQHTRACQLFKEDTPEGQLYAAEKGKEGIQRGEGADMGTIDLSGGGGSLIKTDSLIGEGSCVQDLQFQFMGEPVTIPLSSLCPYLAMLGNILVAVGMVMAIRIVGVR